MYSLLLGAGFSKNEGYPTARELNKKFVDLELNDFYIKSDGILNLNHKNSEVFNIRIVESDFFIEILKYFKALNSEFNYEEFYDFINQQILKSSKSSDLNQICDRIRNKYPYYPIDNSNLFDKALNILNQLTLNYLKNNEGKAYYDDRYLSNRFYPGYTGFFNCLESWAEDNIISVHSLNHDIFFEQFRNSEWIKGDFSDGFEELGSPYFTKYNEKYMVRLRQFTNKFGKKINLFKLHGSIDQYPFKIEGKGTDNYVKVIENFQPTSLYKEIKNCGKFDYINDWTNYHSHFLSGTTSKILEYNEPIYYKKIFRHFKSNLKKSQKLIIIGYGGGDEKINQLLLTNYKYDQFPTYCIDPYPSVNLENLIKKMNGKIIEKCLDTILPIDFIN